MSKAQSIFLVLKLALLCGLVGCRSPAAIEQVNVTFEHVRGLAAAAAAAPYEPPAADLPPPLGALTYDDYRNIRFRPEQALWRNDGVPFRLQFFHRGGIFPDRVIIREFSATHEQVIPFVRDFFGYELTKELGSLHSSLGYAGFRVHTPLNQPDVFDEVIVFLGASYFRAVGAGQVYGLSGRGLAVDCGLPDRAEEFPRFTDFWVGKPKAGDKEITIYALLKGPSVTGAYEFVVHPGKATTVDVRTELIFRRDVTLPGVAPLTSMFWFGENSPHPAGELRREVHDSDGLLVLDELAGRTWRPLSNPATPEFFDAPVKRLVRFGLMQRDRRIGGYEDLEAHFEQRPSVWIEPQGDWGEGAIRLVELPADTEYGDNIVAFWVPTAKPVAGRPVQFSYRMTWSLGDPPADGLGQVVSTHEGPLANVARGRLIWIDFTDENFSARDPATLDAEIEITGGGRVRHRAISRYPQIGGWRIAIEADAAQAGQDIGIRCRLRANLNPITETWTYHWKS